MQAAEETGARLVRMLHRLWSTGDEDLIPHIYADEFVAWWPPSSAVPVRRGRDGIAAGLARVRKAFPDWREDVQDLFACGDRVASRFLGSGTQAGTFAGIAPTGRRVEIQEIATFRIAGDRIAEQWCAFDELGRLQQLGVDEAYLGRVLRRAL